MFLTVSFFFLGLDKNFIPALEFTHSSNTPPFLVKSGTMDQFMFILS